MLKFLKYFMVILVFMLVGSEVFLRKVYGLTDAVLFREDEDFEYIPLPQNRQRFKNNVFYNSFSQRNREIASTDSVILGFGDSVLNGGVQVRQDSLVTEKLSRHFSELSNRDVLFTNISAPSWGPDNCYAYLKKYGNFGANQILLFVSSHDAYDNMTFDKVVGSHVNYPKEQYQFAISELIERYIYPRYLQDLILERKVSNFDVNKLAIDKYKEGMNFNSGFKKFKNYSDSTGIPLLIYLHAERSERETGKYNSQGQLIIEFCKMNSIPLIQELDYSYPDDVYIDNIHLSEKGHYLMYEILRDTLK